MQPDKTRFADAAPEMRSQRQTVEAQLERLPDAYTALISDWLACYRGREAAASAVNIWLSTVQPRLIEHGIQRGITLWFAPLSSLQPDHLPVWPLQDWKIEFGPSCTRRFINRARLGAPMFKQKGRDLCGTDSRFIGLISTAVLCSVGLTAPDSPLIPSSNLDHFALVFDHIHRYMLRIVEQQASTIQTIETRRQAGHREWLDRVPTLKSPAQRRQTDAAQIFDWALEQTWPMQELKDASLSTILRKQKLWQARRPLLNHVQKLHAVDPAVDLAGNLPLTISDEFMAIEQADQPQGRAVEVLARDLLTVGLWCLQANIEPDTEALLNDTLYALSAALVSSHLSAEVTLPQLASLLDTLGSPRPATGWPAKAVVSSPEQPAGSH